MPQIVEALKSVATEAYYSPKPFERNGKLYEHLGVKRVRSLVLSLYQKFGNSRDSIASDNYYIKGFSREGLKSFERQTRENEGNHLPPQVLLLIGFMGSVTAGNIPLSLLTAGAFVGNGYLIMIQRYHRARISGVLKRKEKLNTEHI